MMKQTLLDNTDSDTPYQRSPDPDAPQPKGCGVDFRFEDLPLINKPSLPPPKPTPPPPPKMLGSQVWQLRLSEVSKFAVPRDEFFDSTYYAHDGAIRVPNITNVGSYTTLKSSPIPGYTTDSQSDDLEAMAKARHVRLSSFEKTASELMTLAKDSDFHRIEDVIQMLPGDEILQSLEVEEIEGLPSSTSNNLIKGSIRVALVHNTETKSVQLHFSVVDGFTEVSVKEQFSWLKSLQQLIICGCIDVSWCLETYAEQCYQYFGIVNKPNFGFQSFNFDYLTRVNFANHYDTLPIDGCVVHSMASRVSERDVGAKAFDEELQVYENPPPCQCCNMEFHCPPITACCLCLTLWPFFCREKMSGPENVANFQAMETHPIGAQANEDVSVKHKIDGVNWTIQAKGRDQVYVIVHYKSLLNNESKTLKMKLKNSSPNPHPDFLAASRFAAQINSHRKLIEHNPITYQPMTVSGPAISTSPSAADFMKMNLFEILVTLCTQKSSSTSRSGKETGCFNDPKFWNIQETVLKHPRKSFVTLILFVGVILLCVFGNKK